MQAWPQREGQQLEVGSLRVVLWHGIGQRQHALVLHGQGAQAAVMANRAAVAVVEERPLRLVMEHLLLVSLRAMRMQQPDRLAV